MKRVSGEKEIRHAIQNLIPFRLASGLLIGDFVTAADTTRLFVTRSHSGEWPLTALAIEHDGKMLGKPVFFRNAEYKSGQATRHLNMVWEHTFADHALTKPQMDTLIEQGLTKTPLNPLGSRPWARQVTYTLPTSWGPPLVYGDYTSCSEVDKQLIAAWRRAAGNPYKIERTIDVGFVASHAASEFGVPACECHQYVCLMNTERETMLLEIWQNLHSYDDDTETVYMPVEVRDRLEAYLTKMGLIPRSK